MTQSRDAGKSISKHNFRDVRSASRDARRDAGKDVDKEASKSIPGRRSKRPEACLFVDAAALFESSSRRAIHDRAVSSTAAPGINLAARAEETETYGTNVTGEASPPTPLGPRSLKSEVQKGMKRFIRVAIRIRPFVPREGLEKDCLEMVGQKVVQIDGRQFAFDHVFDGRQDPLDITGGCSAIGVAGDEAAGIDKAGASQRAVFETLGQQLSNNVIQGFNSCLFAFGATGTGKTTSIMGFHRSPEGKGLLPRMVEVLFQHFNEETEKGSKVKVNVSYLEIYNEKVRDLLVPPLIEEKPSAVQKTLSSGQQQHQQQQPQQQMTVRYHPKLGVFVEGLSSPTVESCEACMELVDFGQNMRSMSSTSLNAQSSRSHAVFTFTFERAAKDGNFVQGAMQFIDLAGREQMDAEHGGNRSLAIERAHINKSLFHLSNTISELSRRARKASAKGRYSLPGNETVPSSFASLYRNSKLTMILSHSLSGNCCTAMIATLSPAESSRVENVATLRFASMARDIKTKPQVQQFTPGRKYLVAALQQEITELRKQIPGRKSPGTEVMEQISHLEALAAHYGRGWDDEKNAAQHMALGRRAYLEELSLTMQADKDKMAKEISIRSEEVAQSCFQLGSSEAVGTGAAVAEFLREGGIAKAQCLAEEANGLVGSLGAHWYSAQILLGCPGGTSSGGLAPVICCWARAGPGAVPSLELAWATPAEDFACRVLPAIRADCSSNAKAEAEVAKITRTEETETLSRASSETELPVDLNAMLDRLQEKSSSLLREGLASLVDGPAAPGEAPFVVGELQHLDKVSNKENTRATSSSIHDAVVAAVAAADDYHRCSNSIGNSQKVVSNSKTCGAGTGMQIYPVARSQPSSPAPPLARGVKPNSPSVPVSPLLAGRQGILNHKGATKLASPYLNSRFTPVNSPPLNSRFTPVNSPPVNSPRMGSPVTHPRQSMNSPLQLSRHSPLVSDLVIGKSSVQVPPSPGVSTPRQAFRLLSDGAICKKTTNAVQMPANPGIASPHQVSRLVSDSVIIGRVKKTDANEMPVLASPGVELRSPQQICRLVSDIVIGNSNSLNSIPAPPMDNMCDEKGICPAEPISNPLSCSPPSPQFSVNQIQTSASSPHPQSTIPASPASPKRSQVCTVLRQASNLTVNPPQPLRSSLPASQTQPSSLSPAQLSARPGLPLRLSLPAHLHRGGHSHTPGTPAHDGSHPLAGASRGSPRNWATSASASNSASRLAWTSSQTQYPPRPTNVVSQVSHARDGSRTPSQDGAWTPTLDGYWTPRTLYVPFTGGIATPRSARGTRDHGTGYTVPPSPMLRSRE